MTDEEYAAPLRPGPFTLNSFEGIRKGLRVPPNLKIWDPSAALGYLSYHDGQEARVGGWIIDKRDSQPLRAFYWFGRTQRGEFTGAGKVLWHNLYLAGFFASFALCEHVVAPLSGANPLRGWHPSFCTKCGLDTSVDSGD